MPLTFPPGPKMSDPSPPHQTGKTWLCSCAVYGFFYNQDAPAAAANSLQSCPTLCDPIDGSPPGSSVSGIFQARTVEWVAISFSSVWEWKVKVKLLSRFRLFRDPMDCSLPGSSVHGIFQARVLEWGAIAFSGRMPLGEAKSLAHGCVTDRSQPQSLSPVLYYSKPKPLCQHFFRFSWFLGNIFSSHPLF